jgi:hypothetical protein
MGTLKKAGLARFLEENRDSGGLWLFIHVPKTAGSSFRKELAQTLRPEKNIHVDYESNEPFAQQMELAVNQFVEADRHKHYRFASGHINMDQALLIRRNRPDTRIITFLRKPSDRVLSDYRYQRTSAHPPYREFIEKYPTLDDYLADPASQNKMTKILTPTHIDPRNMDQVIMFLDENLTFIGIQDAYPLSFSMVFSLLGKSRNPRFHERKTEKTEFNQIELTPELENRIHS